MFYLSTISHLEHAEDIAGFTLPTPRAPILQVWLVFSYSTIPPFSVAFPPKCLQVQHNFVVFGIVLISSS